MSKQDKPQSWWQTLPGTLTAIAGVITALAALVGVLNQAGVFDHQEKAQPQVQPQALSQDPLATPDTNSIPPSLQTTDGWTIIGKYKRGEFFDLKLMVHGDSPAIGRRYDAVENFRLVAKRVKRGADQGQVITLGMVQRGDTVEVLDIFIKIPSTKVVPVWAKLRAVLHKK